MEEWDRLAQVEFAAALGQAMRIPRWIPIANTTLQSKMAGNDPSKP
jgi:hypothetical protein